MTTERLELARAAAREAGAITLEYFRQNNYAVELKRDRSPVTVADRRGEELGEQPGTSGYRWILDPIDGTKSFISGVPLYGTLIGVEFQGRSVVGVIRMPALDEMVSAA